MNRQHKHSFTSCAKKKAPFLSKNKSCTVYPIFGKWRIFTIKDNFQTISKELRMSSPWRALIGCLWLESPVCNPTANNSTWCQKHEAPTVRTKRGARQLPESRASRKRPIRSGHGTTSWFSPWWLAERPRVAPSRTITALNYCHWSSHRYSVIQAKEMLVLNSCVMSQHATAGRGHGPPYCLKKLYVGGFRSPCKIQMIRTWGWKDIYDIFTFGNVTQWRSRENYSFTRQNQHE